MKNDTNAPDVGKKDGFNGGEFQHTPGPWKVTGLSRHGFYCKVRGTRLGQKFPIANCPFVPDSREDKAEAEANARLIAGSPALLKALRIIANLEPDTDRCAADEQIARVWLKRAGLWDEPANNNVVAP